MVFSEVFDSSITTFVGLPKIHFRIQLEKLKEMSVVTKTPDKLLEFKNYTILIIDDDPINLKILIEYLERVNFKIVVERGGEMGLKRAQTLKPDMILLDVMMPGLDGFETCYRLKANENTKDIPVIFMTALDRAEDKVKGFELGSVDYVTKPFQRKEVLARIVTHLRIRDLTLSLNAKIEELVRTRYELVQSEKMASLGRLVAGFAHEINTPIGVAVGAASALRENVYFINQLFEKEEVNEEELLDHLETVDQAAELTLSNLKRAANLVSIFKHTVINQTSEQVRCFEIKALIENTITILHSRFKHTPIQIEVNCPSDLVIKSMPGVLEQIITHLMINSLIHGFDNGKNAGKIFIIVKLVEGLIQLEYVDTGKGIELEALEKIFEPFFTTYRTGGCSGLGLYICYNLITTQLHGTITCESTPSKGVVFNIDYPMNLQS